MEYALYACTGTAVLGTCFVLYILGRTFIRHLRVGYEPCLSKLHFMEGHPKLQSFGAGFLVTLWATGNVIFLLAIMIFIVIGWLLTIILGFLDIILGPSKDPKRKKGGPLFGSRTVEAMFLDKHYDPANVWAARKVRDTFFRF